MIEVDRTQAAQPASLQKKFRDGKTELDRATAHYIDDGKSTAFEFNRYRNADVKRALDEIFHGKCAYCESFYAKTQPVDVEHYRPTGKVDDAGDHRGYWWLAMNWENLVPSCIDCNRKRRQITPKPDEHGTMVELNENGDFARGEIMNSGKQSAFPLATNSPRAKWDLNGKATDVALEKRLLLDPTRDTPDDHLVFHVTRAEPEKLISIVYPKPLDAGDALVLPVLGGPEAVAGEADDSLVSAIGAVSIQVYGLNRLALVQARTKTLRDLDLLLEISISLDSLNTEIKDRIADRKARIAAATGAAEAQLKKDQSLDQRISQRMGELTDKTLDQITAMTGPKAQFSALAKAWVAAFVNS
jgi:hypothetical protein